MRGTFRSLIDATRVVPGVSEPPRDLYDAAYLEGLFDEMSRSYERVNYVTSFGFSLRWRRQTVAALGLARGEVVADLMTGMGECWLPILRAVGPEGRVVAVDISGGVLGHARKRRERLDAQNVTILKENALATSLPDACVDAVLSTFGLKTLSPEQWSRFAREVQRILKPGGRFALIEVSAPRGPALRAAYMLYLQVGIPLVGRLFLGNPENYRMLGRYTERFGDARRVLPAFEAVGLRTSYVERFFGCATGLVGEKPAQAEGSAGRGNSFTARS